MTRPDLPRNRLRAPEFPKSFAWVNTDRPLYIHEELRGSVVVLDFWTYCCINCMHVLPDLRYLEHKYAGQPLVVVGVHSAKFDNEDNQRNIETACARYGIEHPVIVDENHRIWSEYGVRAWPTLVVIDYEGRVVGSVSGEGHRETLDTVIAALLDEGQERGALVKSPPAVQRKGRVPARSGLAFPGKVLAEPAGKFLFIADSGHDRIVICDPSGKVSAIAGSGEKGQRDGSFTSASFNNPQGLAYDADSEVLYVADTDNHLVRRLDLRAETVETVCGNGEQGYDRRGGGRGRAQALNSPWDLAWSGSQLYIAMAGNHQIWVLDPATGVAQAWVGSGAENIVDGFGASAALAQPSGLALAGDWLYFADSEVSAVRRANLASREVQTLIGSGLFDFGDRDGPLSRALLQHPLGVAVWQEDILIADTYNHKIKRIRAREGTVESLAFGDPPLALYEPGGLSVGGDTLYIADTNHDRIVVADLAKGTWHELELRGLRTLETRMRDTTGVPVVNVPVRAGDSLCVRMTASFPPGLHVNADVPITYTFQSLSQAQGIEGHTAELPATFAIAANGGEEYLASLSFAYCTDTNRGLCVPVTLRWRVRTVSGSSSDGELKLTAPVTRL